jgi:hypothetical protein
MLPANSLPQPDKPIDGLQQQGSLAKDAQYMRRALDLAALGLGRTRPNPAVGCVVLDADGEVCRTHLLESFNKPHLSDTGTR